MNYILFTGIIISMQNRIIIIYYYYLLYNCSKFFFLIVFIYIYIYSTWPVIISNYTIIRKAALRDVNIYYIDQVERHNSLV